MKNITVLLREEVADLGGIGDLVKVAPGYARNYLFPYRYATEATPYNMKMMERRRVKFAAETVAREAEIGQKIESLGRLVLRTAEKADDSGNLYGSVGAARIAELLTAAGHPTADKDVRIDEPIKTLGTHEVPIHIFGEHYAGIQILVESTAD